MAQLRVRRWAVKSDGVAPEIDRYIDRQDAVSDSEACMVSLKRSHLWRK